MEICHPRIAIRSLWIAVALFCSAMGTSSAEAAIDVGLDSNLPEVVSMAPATDNVPSLIEDTRIDFGFQMVDGSTPTGPLFGLLVGRIGDLSDHDGRWIRWRRERVDELRAVQLLDDIPRLILV